MDNKIFEPNWKKILKGKTEYYGNVEAAFEFAAGEYARQYHDYFVSKFGADVRKKELVDFYEYLREAGRLYADRMAHEIMVTDANNYIMENGFIKQTANDYAMSYEEVERIYKNNPIENGFYEKLEEYVSDRAKRNENQK